MDPLVHSIRAKMATRYWRAAEKFHDRWPNYSPEARAYIARAWAVSNGGQS